MAGFKRGDEVRCVTAPLTGNLTLGKLYEVLYSRRADKPTLINDNGKPVRYDADLFVEAANEVEV